MSDYKEFYERWLTSDVVDEDTKKDLSEISGNEKEIEERFYRELEFGTAGMRGILGAGTNRMNIYNVRRATMGVLKRVQMLGEEAMKKGVLIGYDTRNFSDTFARETACVLAAGGVRAYLYDCVHSVPEVSFGIRELGCSLGVVITASHNPKEYNGYKVYGPDGGQLPPDAAEIVIDAINECDVFDDVITMPFDKAKEDGLIEIVGKELDEKFLTAISTQQLNPDAVKAVSECFKLIYTPLHGTGSRPVQAILKRIGFENVIVVKEQDTEDGNFPTVKSPNPEEKDSFNIAVKMAKENDVDLIIGTDPDCDRVGVVVRDANGEYRVLTGNQTGALMLEYILSQKKEQGTLKDNSIVIKTIVTTELATAITKAYDVEILDVLTGFKYIGEKMTEYEKTGSHSYVFGFEESYGSLAGTHARDKDGVVATMLICEMAAFYKTKNMSLYEAMQEIYKKYGYYCEKTVSFTMPGKDGMEEMAKLLKGLRTNPLTRVYGMDIISVTDYLAQTITTDNNTSTFDNLPKSDVLKYNLSDNKSSFIIRPSGTEPKIKFYMASSADDYKTAEKTVENMLDDIKKQLNL